MHEITPTPSERIAGLDGLRGIAIVAVLCFHGQWSWMRGGFGGVSLFFTISGYLITRLILDEYRLSETIALATFWRRRARRLLPLAWLIVAVVVAHSWAFDGDIGGVRSDALGSFAQVTNLQQILQGHSYASLFNGASPLIHYWSLAVEVQLYIALPLLLLCLLKLRPKVAGSWMALLCVVSWSMPIALGWSVDRVYFGPDSRAGELLIGSLAAIVLTRPVVQGAITGHALLRTTLSTLGLVALGATAVLWVGLNETSGFIARGWLPLQGILSVAIIAAATLPRGPVARLTRGRLLCALGAISYAVYLVHWPIMVWLAGSPMWSDQLVRFVAAVTASIGLGLLLSRLVERPFRERRGAVRRLVVVAAVTVTIIALVTVDPVTGRFDADTAAAQLREMRASSVNSEIEPTSTVALDTTAAAPTTVPVPTTVAAPTTVPVPVPTGPPTVAAFGDSVTLSLALLISGWEQHTREIRGADGSLDLGCGVARGGLRKFAGTERIRSRCDDWARLWGAAIAANHPDVAVVSTGQWETVDRRLAGDARWRSLGDATYDAYLLSELTAATDLLSADGALVIWLTSAPFGSAADIGANADARRSHQPARVARLNAIIAEVVASRPKTSRLVDLGGWMSSRADDRSIRRDGSHYDFIIGSPVPDWLGSEIVTAWRQWFAEAHAG